MITSSNKEQHECNNNKEFHLLITKNNNSTRSPYASYYSSKELPISIYESPYDIYEDEDTIPTPIKLIGRNNDAYRNALKNGYIQSFVCTHERPHVKQHHTFYSSFKENALSVSSSHLELLRSVNNESNSKNEITLHHKESIPYKKTTSIQKPLFKTTQMIYIKSKPIPCSLNMNKKQSNQNTNNTPININKTPPRFESNYTQTINLTCDINLNRSIQEIDSNSLIILDDNYNDNNHFDKNSNSLSNNMNNNPIKNNKLCSIQSLLNNIHISNDESQMRNDSCECSNKKEEEILITTPSQLGSTSRTTTKHNSGNNNMFKQKAHIIKNNEHNKISKDKVIDIKVKEVRRKDNQCNNKKKYICNTTTNKKKYISKRNNMNRNEQFLPSSISISSLAKPKMKIYTNTYNNMNNKNITSSRIKHPIKFDNENIITNSYLHKSKNTMNRNDDNIFLKKHSNIFHTLNKIN